MKTRPKRCPREGPPDAQVVLVGQNPGEEEDKESRPFVGKAGDFLNTILKENNIDRQQLFITNVVKHKTPRARLANHMNITHQNWKMRIKRQVHLLHQDKYQKNANANQGRLLVYSILCLASRFPCRGIPAKNSR